MKFEVNRLIMLAAAKSAARVAPSNAPVEELNGILLEADEDTGEVFLTATNYEVTIQHKVAASVEESGSMLVSPRLFTEMMSLFEGEFVTLSAESPTTLKVMGGRCTLRIYCLPAKGYPKPVMPFPEECVNMTGICSLAKRTTFAVSKEEKKPALQCVNIKLKNNSVQAAACDGARMMLVKDSSGPTDEREFLLPGRALSMLALISSDSDVFEVGDIGKEIVFVRGDMMFSIRKLFMGDYIDAAALIKNMKPVYFAIADAGEMKEAIGLLSVSSSIGDANEPINLVLSGNEIILSCDGDYSEASTAVPAKGVQDTPAAGFYYNVSLLSKLFQVINGKVKLEISDKGFMVIKTRSEVYFQAPLGQQAKRAKAENRTLCAKGAKEANKVA